MVMYNLINTHTHTHTLVRLLTRVKAICMGVVVAAIIIVPTAAVDKVGVSPLI